MAPSCLVLDVMEEPSASYILLLADIYEVRGIPEAQDCVVEVTVGAAAKKCQWCGPDTGEKEEDETTMTFTYSEKRGRVEGISIVPPDENAQKCDVIINVWIKTLTGVTRVAYRRIPFKDLKAGLTGIPRWINCYGTPTFPSVSVSVLASITHAREDPDPRPARNEPEALPFVLRAYIMATLERD